MASSTAADAAKAKKRAKAPKKKAAKKAGKKKTAKKATKKAGKPAPKRSEAEDALDPKKLRVELSQVEAAILALGRKDDHDTLGAHIEVASLEARRCHLEAALTRDSKERRMWVREALEAMKRLAAMESEARDVMIRFIVADREEDREAIASLQRQVSSLSRRAVERWTRPPSLALEH